MQQEQYMQELRETYQNTDMIAMAKQEARAMLLHAVAQAVAAGALPSAQLPNFVVEQPADAKNGDLAANLAMVSAKVFGMAPRQIAQAVADHMPTDGMVERCEVAGPGFINMYIAPAWFGSVVMAACVCADDYGRTAVGGGERVNVEFVSANPTGPMHLGNARGGALGDCLAEAFNWAGYDAQREFYINDAGNQIDKFGRSLAARYMQIVLSEDAVEFPEDGYQGEDIKQRAQEFYEVHGDAYAEKDEGEREKALIEDALPKNIQSLKDDLATYRIEYDTWFSEQTLHDSGAVAAAVEKMVQCGAAYTKDGAVWYKATEQGAEKDEVLVRANGVPTYFAADIAYHIDKFERGYTSLVDVWGADHHGHVARLKSALTSLGYAGDKLDIVLMQFVRLVQDGQPVKMSKRTGKAITLASLLDEVPIDSARFFFNLREPGSSIEFDMNLAVAQDGESPVYYVQYAHARVCSIIRALEKESISFEPVLAFGNTNKLDSDAERELIRSIAAFPGEIVAAAQGRDPARITRYLVSLGAAFHKFYANCRIKGEAQELLQARLALAVATKTVLKNGLTILKVTAPEAM